MFLIQFQKYLVLVLVVVIVIIIVSNALSDNTNISTHFEVHGASSSMAGKNSKKSVSLEAMCVQNCPRFSFACILPGHSEP